MIIVVCLTGRYIFILSSAQSSTTPCVHDIMLNHFVCLEVVEELPTDSIHQIYYRDCRDNARYVKIDYPVSGPFIF